MEQNEDNKEAPKPTEMREIKTGVTECGVVNHGDYAFFKFNLSEKDQLVTIK